MNVFNKIFLAVLIVFASIMIYGALTSDSDAETHRKHQEKIRKEYFEKKQKKYKDSIENNKTSQIRMFYLN